MNNRKENPSHDEIANLVTQAKHRPLPKSTKALAVFVMVGLIFTGGLAYGKHKATGSAGASLSLAGLTSGGFGGGFPGGFAGRNRNGASGTTGTSGTLSDGFAPNGTGTATAISTDVAGTVVSVTAKTVVIQTLSGEKQSFPLLTNTRVRVSTAGALAGVKAGDIVTIKPDASSAAKTITVVK